MPSYSCEVGDRQPAVLGARRQDDGARRDLVIVLQAHDVALCSGLECERAIWGRGARVELPRLGDRAARELRAADPGRETEVVLDPSRRAGLPAERGALHDERLEALGCPVHRRSQAGRSASDHDAGRRPRAQRARARSRAHATPRRSTGCAARSRRAIARAEPRRGERVDQRRDCRIVGVLRIAPGIREAIASGELDDPPRRLR